MNSYAGGGWQTFVKSLLFVNFKPYTSFDFHFSLLNMNLNNMNIFFLPATFEKTRDIARVFSILCRQLAYQTVEIDGNFKYIDLDQLFASFDIRNGIIFNLLRSFNIQNFE